jgi:hypothetical protein
MEIVIAVVVVVICAGVVGATLGRRDARVVEDELEAIAPGAHVDRQFERPRNENELL